MKLRTLLLNAGTNAGATVANVLAGFLVMPFLISTLGAGLYGSWILIGSIGGYFGLIDMGAAASVGRLVAAQRADGRMVDINSTVSTAAVLLRGAFLLTCAATAGAIWLFPIIFPAPETQSADALLAIGIIGLNMAMTFSGYVHYGFLWGYSRFDLLGAVDICGTVVRAVATFACVRSHAWPLLTLATITAIANGLSILVRAVLCHKVEPRLHVSGRHFARSRVREIFSFGIWMNLLSTSRSLIPQLPLAFIGHFHSPAAVTSLAVARQMVSYVNTFSITVTQVLAPHAMALHAAGKEAGKRALFVEGGRYATALAVLLAGGVALFARPFFQLWQPTLPVVAGELAVILALGELLPMSQWLTYSVIVGSQRHRLLAVLALCEAVLVVLSAALLLARGGVVAVTCGMAAAALLTRGLAPLRACGRMLAVGMSEYRRVVLLPVLRVAVLPVLLTAAACWPVVHWTWLRLVFASMAFVTAFGYCVYRSLLPADVRAQLRVMAGRALRAWPGRK